MAIVPCENKLCFLGGLQIYHGNILLNVGLRVLTALFMNMLLFLDVTLYGLVLMTAVE